VSTKSAQPVLYHYCPTDSFFSIVEHKSIWLTSLSQSNDYMEGRLASQVTARLAQRENLNTAQLKQVQDLIRQIEDSRDGLGFCLSEEPDLLSQWRGYASDGTGVSIGFSTDYLNWLAESANGKSSRLTLEKVVYDTASHDSLAEPAYQLAKQFYEELSNKPIRVDKSLWGDLQLILEMVPKLLTIETQQLFKALYLLKAETFREELEWRLISNRWNNFPKVCSYRLRNNMIAPYLSIELSELNRIPIVEVILGPKHQPPINVVKQFLNHNGFGNVKVTQSATTYR
jgi:hypothetical protein